MTKSRLAGMAVGIAGVLLCGAEFPPPGVVGHVLRNGAGVVGARVEVQRCEGGQPQAVTSVVTEANGRFVLRGLPAGDYRAVVDHQGLSARMGFHSRGLDDAGQMGTFDLEPDGVGPLGRGRLTVALEAPATLEVIDPLGRVSDGRRRDALSGFWTIRAKGKDGTVRERMVVVLPGSPTEVKALPGVARQRDCTRVGPANACVDRAQVSVAEYLECVRAGACPQASEHTLHGKIAFGRPTPFEAMVDLACHVNARSPLLPMNCLEWSGAEAYCTWVGGRLPSIAELTTLPAGLLAGEWSSTPAETTPCTWDDLRASVQVVRWRNAAQLSVLRDVHDEIDGRYPRGSLPNVPAERTVRHASGLAGWVGFRCAVSTK